MLLQESAAAEASTEIGTAERKLNVFLSLIRSSAAIAPSEERVLVIPGPKGTTEQNVSTGSIATINRTKEEPLPNHELVEETAGHTRNAPVMARNRLAE